MADRRKNQAVNTQQRQAALRAALSAVPSPSFAGAEPTRHVPVNETQWRAVLADASIASAWDEFAAAVADLADLANAPLSEIGKRIPADATALVDRAQAIVANLEGVAWFDIPDDSAVSPEQLDQLSKVVRTTSEKALARVPTGDVEIAAELDQGNDIVRAVNDEMSQVV